MERLPEKLPFSKKRLPKKVIFSYILDYVIIIVLAVTFTVLDAVEPYHQHFSLQNYTLQYPYAVHERIPVSFLVVLAVGFPMLVIAVYTIILDGLFSHSLPPVVGAGIRRKLAGKYRLKDRLWELNCGILGLLLAVGAAFTITGTLKNAIGKPRPDLIDRCRPKSGSADPPVFGLSNSTICEQEDHAILKDGFRSFPSGHSSTAFAGLFYLSLYLAAKMHVLDSKGEVWKTFIILIPTLAAALIAGSRIMDARHHPFDVISGSLLGILVAWAAYRQYFPPVTETWRKGRAYPIRSWGKEPQPPEIIRRPIDQSDESYESTIPLNKVSLQRDEEAGSTTALATPEEGNGDNVFRAQVSASQRHRDNQHRGVSSSQYSADQTTTRGPSSTYTSHLPGSNPFAPTPVGQPRDGYWSSSSEDEDDRHADYELQQTYPLGNPQGPGVGYGQDTAYHSQQGAAPQRLESIRESGTFHQPPPEDHSGDLSSQPPAPPPHGSPTRGVQLTETYVNKP